MSLRRIAIGLALMLIGAGVAITGWRAASAAGGAVTVGPDLAFHDSANTSSSQTTINAGDSVVFTWTGGVMHSVTADDGSFDSGLQSSGTFSHTFTTAGTYRYYCSVHGGPGGVGMSGVITVLAAATPTATTAPATSTSTASAATNTPQATGTPAPTNTPGAGTPTVTRTQAASSTPAAAIVAAGTTPAARLGAGSALPSTGSAGNGGGRSWFVWGGAAVALAGAAGLGLGLRKRRGGASR